ncbi:MAG: PH domain-containing protein [Sphingomonadaceae bacterium]|nr:PH domain-containing protein [Sphingomonadaceae bacterium]
MEERPLPTPQRTNPLGMIALAAQGLGKSALPMVAAMFGLRNEFSGIALVLVALAGVGAIMAVLAFLRWHRLTYVVGAEDIRVESGIISRAARSVPYERIQDVSLEQKLLPRLLGLVEVRFETGAGGKDELKLAYLSAEEGARLREVIRERREEEAETPAASMAEQEAQPDSPPIFAMGPGRLLRFGLFEFSLAAVAVVGGLAQQFDFLLPFDIWDWEEWSGIVAGPGEQIAHLGPYAQAAGIVLALGSLVVLGFATGIARTFTREWGFRLDRTPKGFRRQRGLFTRTDVVMPAHRVQAVQLGTRILRRRFGWHSLKFVSLAQDAGKASHVVAPFAKLAEIDPIIRAAGFEPASDGLEWHRASRAYLTDSMVLVGGFFALLALGLGIAVNPLLGFAPLALGMALVLGEQISWHHLLHASDAHQLYSRHGWLAPKSQIASRVKLHSAEISQGPLAQRRGYATLVLGLAGGVLAIKGLPVERARALRAAVLESMTGTDFSELR